MVETAFLASSFLYYLGETACHQTSSHSSFNSRAIRPDGMLSVFPPFRNLQGFHLFPYNCPTVKGPHFAIHEWPGPSVDVEEWQAGHPWTRGWHAIARPSVEVRPSMNGLDPPLAPNRADNLTPVYTNQDSLACRPRQGGIP